MRERHPISGLVFTVLSVPLLYHWVAWDEYVSDDLNYLAALHDGDVTHDRKEIVVLSQVLVHKENMSYDKRWAKHLDKLNGIKVESLWHLKRMLENGAIIMPTPTLMTVLSLCCDCVAFRLNFNPYPNDEFVWLIY